VSITNAPGKGSYPVSTFTYLLVPAVIPNPAKRDAIKQFLEWMLTDGQKSAAQMSYAPLPGQVVKMETALISSIQ
ncbi:MAG: phosphate ABC transporter substrate-binding protein PstS, partial [Acidobacteriota bacterium]|nr:phosphate ABC transporter substrate-binding protein PstS [Acidobacteriota bacterium]